MICGVFSRSVDFVYVGGELMTTQKAARLERVEAKRLAEAEAVEQFNREFLDSL